MGQAPIKSIREPDGLATFLILRSYRQCPLRNRRYEDIPLSRFAKLCSQPTARTLPRRTRLGREGLLPLRSSAPSPPNTQ
jgi:hypothetical protein